VGEVSVLALDDGEFRMPVDFLTDPTAHRELAGPDGVARLPVGCFLVPGDEPVLVDLGYGPRTDPLLTGGALPARLAAVGLRPEDVPTIALSHPHPDHVGWLATPEGELVFPRARVVMAAADWEHFVRARTGSLAEHLHAALLDLYDRGRLTLLAGEEPVTSSVTALPAPGHTPGHTVFVVHDRGERALLLGDAVHCPQQLTHADWGALGDVDRALARRTREWLQRDLEQHGGVAVGSHFPELTALRLLGGSR
jgi:glyoxylase-like metal-dependent hydrolase (beta-lactamase superfamily II)